MEIIRFGDPDARTVLIQPVDDHDLGYIESEIGRIQRFTDTEFEHIAFRVGSWNRDLSPWKAPAVFGNEDFGSGARDTLDRIIEECGERTKTYYIGGYSLAGLFALWAACQTDLFRGVAAASPSVWFPGFTDHIRNNRIMSERVYLSLGDKEEKTRNPVMASVGDRIRETYDLLRAQNIDCVLEWNEGNHFRDPELRTAKAFAWVINRKGPETVIR